MKINSEPAATTHHMRSRGYDGGRWTPNSITLARWDGMILLHYRRVRRRGLSARHARDLIWEVLFAAHIDPPEFHSGIEAARERG